MSNPSLVRKNTQWLSGASYTAGDVVWTSSNNIQYPITCLVTHTAGTFATDVISGYWQIAVPMKNNIINGNFDIWQRNTSAAFATTYATADRIFTFRGGGAVSATASRQLATAWTASGQIPQYCFRMQRDAGNAQVNSLEMIQAFETVNSIPLAGRTVTISFYARCGTNFSPTGSLFTAYVGTGTGTDQGVVAAWTGSATPIINSALVATTVWQRYSITGVIPSTATQLRWDIQFIPVGTAGANDYLEVAQVMINEGSVPAAFQSISATVHDELATCQRYWQRVSFSKHTGWIRDGSDDYATDGYTFPVIMRNTPTPTASPLTSYVLHVPNEISVNPTTINVSTTANQFYFTGVYTNALGAPVRVMEFSGGATTFDAEL